MTLNKHSTSSGSTAFLASGSHNLLPGQLQNSVTRKNPARKCSVLHQSSRFYSVLIHSPELNRLILISDVGTGCDPTTSIPFTADVLCTFTLIPYGDSRLFQIKNRKSEIENDHCAPDFLNDSEIFYFHFGPASAAETGTENCGEKKLRKLETNLRFSVQTENFSRLPTTYIDFHEKLKKQKLGTDTTIVDSKVLAWAARKETQSSVHSPDVLPSEEPLVQIKNPKSEMILSAP